MDFPRHGVRYVGLQRVWHWNLEFDLSNQWPDEFARFEKILWSLKGVT